MKNSNTPESRMQNAESSESGRQSEIESKKRHHFRDLLCWQKSREVRNAMYRIAETLPDFEKYALANQIRRAAVSITANIAEGYGRYHYQEGLQFYRIARGSLYELKDHLISCFDFQYISREMHEHGSHLIEVAKKTLNGYIQFVRKQKNR